MTLSAERVSRLGGSVGRRRRGGAGFTLVELLVSLVAGLIVATAVMGVSKEATSTFHEEVRVSGAEMALRISMERIRLDLQRAAFMGTGNLLGDPLIAHLANYTAVTPPTNLSNFSGGTVPYSLLNLSGISVYPQGQSPLNLAVVPSNVMNDAAAPAEFTAQGQANSPFPALLNPGVLAPDVIDIAGNMSSSDEYAASIVWNPPKPPKNCAAGAAIQLEMTTPAGWRIRNAEGLAHGAGAAWGTVLQGVFHPGLSPTSSFMLRVTDQSGRYQYLIGCPGALNAAVYDGSVSPPTATVYLAPTVPIATTSVPNPTSSLLSSNQTGGLGGIGGFAAGLVTVSPLEITRWSIQSPVQLAAVAPASTNIGATNTYVFGATTTADPTDYMLTRSYVDLAGCGTGTPCGIDPYTTEVIAEYAIDLKFGLTVDSFLNPNCTAFPCPLNAPTYTQNPLANIPMDGAPATFGGFGAVEGVYVPNGGPERIRDVQARVGIRSPFADRAASLPVPTDSAIPDGYLFRYLLPANAPRYAPGTPYARVREATTEVNLPNQARFYW